MNSRHIAGYAIAVVFFLTFQILPIFPSETVADMASVASMMVVLWVTQALPLAATALLPLVLFPTMGILNAKEVASVYTNSTIFLFIGGFVLALSMQRWDLHTRIALRIISWFHGSAMFMVLGFMVTAAFLSMWISNTATATMLLPIGLAVYSRASENLDAVDSQKLLTALMLGIAYSCSIGGTGTLIGTPPNLAMQRIFSISFPQAPTISFAEWLIFAILLSLSMLIICWVLLSIRYTGRQFTALAYSKEQLYQSSQKPMSFEEKAVAIVFGLTAIGWVFRHEIDLGWINIPGWSELFESGSFINDGTVAMMAALALFIIPSKDKSKYTRLADAETISGLPWNIVLLFGGGFALAKGFTVSGLAEFVGQQFVGLQDTDPLTLIAGVSTMVVFLTEVTSNTATAEMLLPLVASIAKSIEINPLLLMLPVTLSASMAFMMPVATPPNAIVFASGKLDIMDMIKTGIILNICAILLITIATLVISPAVFNIDIGVMPNWAK